MFNKSIDFRSLPSNPLKDLLIFEERIQHNLNSLHRLRFQALLRIFLGIMGFGILFYSYKWSSAFDGHNWLTWICLLGSGLFFILLIFFLIHTLYTRRLTLLNRYRSQCQKILRIYNLDIRSGLDPRHVDSIDPEMKEYYKAMQKNKNGYYLTIKRRIAGKIYDLLDAYRLEYWKIKIKKKGHNLNKIK